MSDRKRIEREIARQTADHAALIGKLSRRWSGVLAEMASALADCLRGGGKVLLAGNGGSAADAQHVAGELVGRFRRERPAWPAIALTTDSSVMTAIGNDYHFNRVFRRQVEALAAPGDVLWLFSTSGNSVNVLEAAREGRRRGAIVIGFTGGDGGRLAKLADLALVAPHKMTARVQEAHALAYHILCDLVEAELTEEA